MCFNIGFNICLPNSLRKIALTDMSYKTYVSQTYPQNFLQKLV